MKDIYGATIYKATFERNSGCNVHAFDLDGANYIAANTSALYGWGAVTSIEEATA